MATKTLAEYKDQITLDNRLKFQLGTSRSSVKKAHDLFEKAMQGDLAADGRLRELATTSTLSLDLAHLVNVNFIPQLDALERSIVPLVGTGARTVPDFRPVILQSLFGNLDGAGIGANGEAVTVPEGTPYPKVSVTGAEAFYTKLAKRGVSFDFTWEARVNDTVGFFADMPQELLGLTDDTEYAEIFDALLQANEELPSVTLPDGTVVPTNAPVSPNAIFAAIIALAERTINGRKIGTLTGYTVIVPTGRKMFVDWQMRQFQNIVSIQDGAVTFGAPDNSVLSTVEVIESDRVTGTTWYLKPKPGATRRPVLELLKLRGYTAPELRVSADAGLYLGGGTVPGLEGSFEADTISYRYRYVVGGVLWDDTWIVFSEGDGDA